MENANLAPFLNFTFYPYGKIDLNDGDKIFELRRTFNFLVKKFITENKVMCVLK